MAECEYCARVIRPLPELSVLERTGFGVKVGEYTTYFPRYSPEWIMNLPESDRNRLIERLAEVFANYKPLNIDN